MWKRLTREQRTDHIKLLAYDGWSAGTIAARMGTTRNAVIGHANRHEIRLTGKPTGIKGKMHQPIRSPLMEASPNDPPLAGSTPTPLLGTTGCRWPVEGGFCNCKVHKKLYCADHYARAYRPVAPVHPLLIKLATLGPQKPKTFAGCQAYNGLVRDRLVMFRVGPDGHSTYYLTDLGRENTPGY